MTPADLNRLSKLLDDALDLPMTARANWLAALDGDAAPLVPTLRKLLARSARVETADVLARGPLFTAPHPSDEAPVFQGGDSVGPYLLLRAIGHGGMGEVWLAERRDGQLKRQVALKLPMLGLRRSVLVQRFARERDILGALTHPHIARLYDAGLASDGQPYLALEYVEGTPVTTYCAVHQLAARERVQLLLQVIDAVQYAHANLVIHRDLKPSNVLVTAQGQAMLLDFGIAKLLQADASSAEATELTQIGGRALTLEYAAPEQVAGGPVSIATDVYALGTLLYELLTGHRPFKGTRHDLEHAVLTQDPPRPSALAADLSTIVLKALKKLPAARYATVDALAADLGRWLRAEPVLAQADSFGYRLSRFIVRRRVPVAAGTAAAMALLAASGVAMYQAQQATQQAEMARHEARRAQRESDDALAVRDFLVGVFRSNDPDSIAYSAQPANTVRDVLNAGLARLRAQMDDHPEVKSALFEAMTDILSNLGDDAQAIALASEHQAFVVARMGKHQLRYVNALLQEAAARRAYGQEGLALERLVLAEAVLDDLHDQDSIVRGRQLILKGTLLDRSSDDSGTNLALRGVKILEARHAPAVERAQALLDVGLRLMQLDRVAKALDAFDAAVKTAKGFDGAALIESRAWATRARALLSVERVAEAIESQRRAVRSALELPTAHPEMARQVLMLGSLLHRYGERTDGRRHISEGLRLSLLSLPQESIWRINPHLLHYIASLRDGDLVAAHTSRPVLLAALRDESTPPQLRVEIRLALLGDAQLSRDYRLTEATLRDMVASGTALSTYHEARLSLGRAVAAIGRRDMQQVRAHLERVEVLLSEFAEVRSSSDPLETGTDKQEIRRQYSLVGSQAAEVAGHADVALALAHQALALSAIPRGDYAQDVLAEARVRVGAACLAANIPAKAIPHLRAALQFYESTQVAGSPRLDLARRLLARAEAATDKPNVPAKGRL